MRFFPSFFILLFLASPLLRSDTATVSQPAIQQPVIRFANKLGGTNSNQVAGVTTDARGNMYIAGSTASLDFPVLKALQPKAGGSTFFRLDGNQFSPALNPGVLSLTHLAASLQQPGLLYASNAGALQQSVDGGDTWTSIPAVPNSVSDIAIDPTNS